MIRKIISIDEDKCNGCGLCVSACHEGALQMINGKAKLISDSYCDGLGDCLPECPTGAIEIIEREALAYDDDAVKARMGEMACGCPSTLAKTIERSHNPNNNEHNTVAPSFQSELRQWPIQIKLVSPNAPFFKNAKLLIAADCTAYAHPNIHSFMKGKTTIIGCPKLDEVDYSEKLAAILQMNDIESITILRMEVPCCGGIVNAVKNALVASGKLIPWNIVTIKTNGDVTE